LAISLVLVSGCTTPTILRIALVADAGVNPDINGRPSPIVVKLYEMKSLAAFNSADFFSLFNKDQDTLGAELVAREDLQLRPAENRKIERQIQDETRYFGVVAAFRDLERARWRAAITVPEHKKTPVTIQIGARSISIQAQ
jgi:type VI secretion system protein VasD